VRPATTIMRNSSPAIFFYYDTLKSNPGDAAFPNSTFVQPFGRAGAVRSVLRKFGGNGPIQGQPSRSARGGFRTALEEGDEALAGVPRLGPKRNGMLWGNARGSLYSERHSPWFIRAGHARPYSPGDAARPTMGGWRENGRGLLYGARRFRAPGPRPTISGAFRPRRTVLPFETSKLAPTPASMWGQMNRPVDWADDSEDAGGPAGFQWDIFGTHSRALFCRTPILITFFHENDKLRGRWWTRRAEKGPSWGASSTRARRSRRCG